MLHTVDMFKLQTQVIKKYEHLNVKDFACTLRSTLPSSGDNEYYKIETNKAHKFLKKYICFLSTLQIKQMNNI